MCCASSRGSDAHGVKLGYTYARLSWLSAKFEFAVMYTFAGPATPKPSARAQTCMSVTVYMAPRSIWYHGSRSAPKVE